MKKARFIEGVEVTGISAEGFAVGKKNGEIVFLRDSAPGDIVDVRITGRKKKTLLGEPVLFHHRSEDRVTPFCEHFGICGGCKWQHISYEAQLQHKESHVRQNLSKLSGMELPHVESILGAKNTRGYRNKLEFTFTNNRWLTKDQIDSEETFDRRGVGFHVPGMFDKVLDIQHCHLQNEPSNEIRNAIREYAIRHDLDFYDIRKHIGFLRNLIIRISTTGELMVILQFAEDHKEKIEDLLSHILKTFPAINSLMWIVNKKQNDSYFDLPVHLFHGQPFIEEKMGGLTFRLGPKSFYQTNSHQAHELYRIASEFAAFKGDELVYDLYTGIGTIASFIAKDVRKVVGIESVTEAVENAKVNAQLNDIDNVSFFAGDMKDMLSPQFVDAHGAPDVVITDPPRAGMHPRVIERLIELQPDRIVYISCNPATQARDMSLMRDYYKAEKIRSVDMFPHTHHVENIVLLQKLTHA